MENTSDNSDNLMKSIILGSYEPELVVKVNNPDFLLFKEAVKKLPKFNFYNLSFFGTLFLSFFCFLLFAIWLVLFIEQSVHIAVLILWILSFLLFVFPLIISCIKVKNSQDIILKLISTADIFTLKTMYSKNTTSLMNATYKNILAFFALLDLQDDETIHLIPIIDNYNFHIWPKFKGMLSFAKEVLAIKLDYPTVEDFMFAYTDQIAEEYSDNSSDQDFLINTNEDKIAIQISKAYIIPSLPIRAKCMISKAALDSSSDLLVCPYCISFAKADLLQEWLEIKNNCPTCNRLLRIEDCPIVIIKNNK